MSKTNKWMVIDVETTNSLDDPFTYDIGFVIMDKLGRVYTKRSLVVKDIFMNKQLMESAYYIDKVPSYWGEIWDKQREVVTFMEAWRIIRSIIKQYNVKRVYAYNARFDNNALNTTLRYVTKSKYRWFFPYGTKICCIWSMACDTICESLQYKQVAEKYQWLSNNGKNYRSSAEYVYKFITKNYDFVEEHKGIDDVMIEMQILLKCYSYNKPMNIKINRGCWKKITRLA